MGESPNPDWLTQWQALARPYLSAWQNATQTGAPAAATPSREGFEQWARLFTSGSGSQGETIERVIDSTRSYMAFLQSTLAAMANAPGGAQPAWADLLGQGLPGAAAGLFEHPAVRAWREWSAAQGSAGVAPFMGALNALRAPSAQGIDFKALLDLPAFGLLREHQEHHQKSARAWLDYKAQMDRYNALMLDAAQRGFARFEGKLAEREQPGRQIESLRALYDLWVDAAEEGYAEVALSAEFREVYGALVNAQMRVRSQVQQEVERVATDLGMPTRSEINSIGERLQTLRREVRARGEPSALADELADLRAEFAAFKAAAERPPVPAPATTSTKSSPERARPARAAAPARKQAAKSGRASDRSAAAEAGTFASRIQQYAKTSLGSERGKPARAAKPKPSGAKKTRR